MLHSSLTTLSEFVMASFPFYMDSLAILSAPTAVVSGLQLFISLFHMTIDDRHMQRQHNNDIERTQFVAW